MHIHVYPLAKNNQSNVQVQSSDVEVVVVAIVKVQVPAVIPTPTKDMLLLAVDSWLLTEKVGVSEWLTCSHVITFLVQPYSDFAVSLPRRNLYFGSVSDYKFTCVCACVCVCVYWTLQVNIVMNDNDLEFNSQPLMGLQMGEYYGFSLLAVDLNGDKWVGHTPYTVYLNTTVM